MADEIASSSDPFIELRRYTEARIGLDRAGNGLATRPLLDFQLAHARARDAVHTPLDIAQLQGDIGSKLQVVSSTAGDRRTFLARPDLGRRLAEPDKLAPGNHDLAIVVADGLSARAVNTNAPAVIGALRQRLPEWRIADPIIVLQGRVAIGDEVGGRLAARAVLVLIGERPGLSAADSLGAYLTWDPRVGRRDHERNCVSNIRSPGGLDPIMAADKIGWLLNEARRLGLTGVDLKDRHQTPPALGSAHLNLEEQHEQ